MLAMAGPGVWSNTPGLRIFGISSDGPDPVTDCNRSAAAVYVVVREGDGGPTTASRHHQFVPAPPAEDAASRFGGLRLFTIWCPLILLQQPKA